MSNPWYQIETKKKIGKLREISIEDSRTRKVEDNQIHINLHCPRERRGERVCASSAAAIEWEAMKVEKAKQKG